MPGEPIYLDYQATTPTDPRVVEAMLPYFTGTFGNPHSIQHSFGQEAEAAVEKARGQIAALIGAEPREVVFTSGATESNNLAIKGVARFRRQLGRDHLVTCVTEHKCVLESCRRLEGEGFDVTYLPVRENGLVDMAALAEAVTERTAVVSIMAVNNEIGVIQPIAEIGQLCRERGAAFHCDAAQAVGKIPLDVEAAKIDLLSISGHKIYGPMGIGALYLRRRPRIRLEPLFDGGGQERGFRSGTLPAPLCVGLGEACAIAGEAMAEEAERFAALGQAFLGSLQETLGEVLVNGDRVARIPGNLNVSFPGVDAEKLMAAVPDLALSTGSACTSASVEPSYVLRALGLSDARAAASLRISFGRDSSLERVTTAARRIAEAVTGLQAAAAAETRAAE